MKRYLFKNSKIILLFSIGFFILIIANYWTNLYVLKSTIYDLQAQSMNDVSHHLNKWLDIKMDAIQVAQGFMVTLNPDDDQKRIHEILQNSSRMAGFASMFVGYSNDIMLSSHINEKRHINQNTSHFWYQKTLLNQKITITEPYKDDELQRIVVSICIPSTQKDRLQSVLCGTLPLEYIKSEVFDISLPYDGNAFLIDHNQQILVHKDTKQLFHTFAYNLDKCSCTLTTNNCCFDKYIFSYAYIQYPKWYIVAQLDKKKVYEKVDLQLEINILIYGISLTLFLILNLFYNYRGYKSAEKLTRAQALIHSFIDHNEKGFLIADNDQNVTYYNQQFFKLLHVTQFKSEKSFLSVKNLLVKYFPQKTQHGIDKRIQTILKKQITCENKFNICYEKTTISLLCTLSPVINSQGICQGIIIILEDITQQEKAKLQKKEQEDILFQQSKMADLGEMIGAISHQWRQPLNAISIMMGNLLQFKEMGCLDDAIFEENINRTLSNVHYLSNTLDTFRNFYKPSQNLQLFNIEETVKETLLIIDPYFKNTDITIKISKEIKNDLCHNYKNEFQQIIANLMLNAKDALSESNKNQSKQINICIEETDTAYHIKIGDNGSGIKTTFRPMLFKPFKTTKGAKGTGNGLYISQLIARKKLQGELSLLSYENPTIFLLSILKNKEK